MRCAVYGCNSDNQTKSFRATAAEDRVKFFSFPNDKRLRKLWKIACRRADNFSEHNARICSLHFEKESFERNLKYELLNCPPPRTARKLKQGSLPTLCLPKDKYKESKCVDESRNKRMLKRVKKKQLEELRERIEQKDWPIPVKESIPANTISMTSCANRDSKPIEENICALSGGYFVEMKYETDFCFLCLQRQTNFNNIENQGCPTIREKLKCVLPPKIFTKMKPFSKVCVVCTQNVNIIYNFLHSYIGNISTLDEFILKSKNTGRKPVSINLNELFYFKQNRSLYNKNIEPVKNTITEPEVNEAEEIASSENEDQSDYSSMSKVECVYIKVEDTTEDETNDCRINNEENAEKEEDVLKDYSSTQYCESNIETITDSDQEISLQDSSSGEYLENVSETSIRSNDVNPSSANSETTTKQSSSTQHQCKECDRIFYNRHHLIDHIRIHTKERPFNCCVCKKNFSRASHLNRHKITHSSERPIKCTVCEKTFQQKSYLKIHMRTHTGERPYQCGICFQRFKQACGLEIHKKRHNNERPFQCTVCKRTFTEKGVLTKHMRVHTGDKPFECHLCSYKASHRGNLVRHIRAHTKEKLYVCQFCQRAFVVSSNLNRHIQLKHNKGTC